MSRKLVISAVAVWIALLVGSTPPVQAQNGYDAPPPGYLVPENLQVEDFYDRLEPYGRWFDNRRYGRVWQPYDIGPGWRPYTIGHWLLTQDYGWYWASDEIWGWAAYHYGRWVWDEEEGWIWVPGSRWGPAWVAWRRGGGYYGWAPLPPEVVWREQGGFDFHGIDVEADYFRPAWVFVPEQYVVHPHLAHYCLSPEYNVTIVHHSRNITNYVNVQNVVVNHSMDVREVERITRRPLIVQDRGTFGRFGAPVQPSSPARQAQTLSVAPPVGPGRRPQPIYSGPASEHGRPDRDRDEVTDRSRGARLHALEISNSTGRRPYEQNVDDVRRIQQAARAQFEARQQAELARSNEQQRPHLVQQQQVQRLEMERIQNREMHVVQRAQQQSPPPQPVLPQAVPSPRQATEPREHNRNRDGRERP